MPTPPEGTPWWAWLIGVVLAVGLPAILVALIQQHRKVDAVVDQVKNTHDTNLRNDLDEAKLEAKLAKESSHRTERLAEDLIKTVRALEHSIDRRDLLRAEFEGESRADRARIREDLASFRDESRTELAALHRIVDPLGSTE